MDVYQVFRILLMMRLAYDLALDHIRPVRVLAFAISRRSSWVKSSK